MAANSGQTLNDRLNAARYALAGQGLARVVCKATTEEVIGPKKKHLDYLLQCTHEPNVSIPQMANLLIERTNHGSWVVVFKALVTVHHLMCYGNERFTQYLASSNCNFQLSNFLDKTGVKGYDMSTFIRRYSKYINEKALSYRTVAYDFAKIKRGKEEGSLRTMPSEKLLKTVPTLQSQIDALLEFDCNANDLTNGVINAGFMLLFRDLIRLFACYNDGIINLLEKFFEMNKKQCKEALEIYKKFLIRMDRVAEFLKVAENVGIDKGEIPDLTKAPSSLLDALEAHLQSLEGKQGGRAGKGASKDSQEKLGASGPTATTPEATTSNGSNFGQSDLNGIKDDAVKKALEEEAALMNQMKPFEDVLTSLPDIVTDNISERPASPFSWHQESWSALEKHIQDGTKPYNPFLSSPTGDMSPAGESKTIPATSNDILDLFGEGGGGVGASSAISPPSGLPTASGSGSRKASDDLLSLTNNSTSLNTAAAAAPNPFVDVLVGVNVPSTNPMTGGPPSSAFNGASQSIGSSGGVFDANFVAAFGSQASNTSSGFDAFSDILQPQKSGKSGPVAPSAARSAATGLIKGDLDSSLASLAQNLDINGPKGGGMRRPGQQQFNPKAGGGMPMGAGQGPMGNFAPGQGPRVGMGGAGWTPAMGMGPVPGALPAQSGGTGVMPANFGVLGMGSIPPSTGPMQGMVAPIMSGPMGPRMGHSSSPFAGFGTSMTNNYYPQSSGSSSDPFGAL